MGRTKQSAGKAKGGSPLRKQFARKAAGQRAPEDSFDEVSIKSSLSGDTHHEADGDVPLIQSLLQFAQSSQADFGILNRTLESVQTKVEAQKENAQADLEVLKAMVAGKERDMEKLELVQAELETLQDTVKQTVERKGKEIEKLGQKVSDELRKKREEHSIPPEINLAEPEDQSTQRAQSAATDDPRDTQDGEMERARALAPPTQTSTSALVTAAESCRSSERRNKQRRLDHCSTVIRRNARRTSRGDKVPKKAETTTIKKIKKAKMSRGAQRRRKPAPKHGVLTGFRVAKKYGTEDNKVDVHKSGQSRATKRLSSAFYLGTVHKYRPPPTEGDVLPCKVPKNSTNPSYSGCYRVLFDDGDVEDFSPEETNGICREYNEMCTRPTSDLPVVGRATGDKFANLQAGREEVHEMNGNQPFDELELAVEQEQYHKNWNDGPDSLIGRDDEGSCTDVRLNGHR